MGGAGFPTYIKLSPKEPEKIDYVIANCAECEPYLTSDYRRMLEEPEKLVDGMKVYLKRFENARGILAWYKAARTCFHAAPAIDTWARLHTRDIILRQAQKRRRRLRRGHIQRRDP